METDSTETTKRCSACGSAIENSKAKFCSDCGAKIIVPQKTPKSKGIRAGILWIYIGIGLILLGIIAYDGVNKEGGNGHNTNNVEVKTELDLMKDSLNNAASQKTGLSVEDIKYFEKEIGGFTIVSVETGTLPVNFFQSAPVFSMVLVNTGSQINKWDKSMSCRVVIDENFVCPSHSLKNEPNYKDPILPGQHIIISSGAYSGDNWVKEAQLKKSKICIEILKSDERILLLPIKNQLFKMKDVIY